MRIPSLVSIAGFILVIAATYCPMLRAFGLVSMNVYDMMKPYGIVMFFVAIIGMVGLVFGQLRLARIAAIATAVLAVLLYIGAVLKVNTSFSFLPLNSVAVYLSSKIKFKWGWYVLFGGAVLSLSVLFSRQSAVAKHTEELK